ncbi:FG-GAP-like repeat-containing protein [Streptomyces sp. V4-01]|uniref:FG-GAP-like repeat-containing protein n=1 Tax=Actinacidiphila polyblastidii TaxID=3110430 RepID=A0ABU7PGX4_9ACTN|nr:FG-GAP-like repeat-containing protein [Streptomyces sp. V4-01]
MYHALHRFRTGAAAMAVCALAGGLVAAGSAPARATTPYSSLTAAFDDVAVHSGSATATRAAASGASTGAGGGGFLAADLDRAGWSRGATVSVNGTPYTLADVPPGAPDNVVAAGQTVAVRGSGDALGFLAAADDGPVSAAGTITYTDGTTSRYTLAVDDWSGTADANTAVAVPHHLDSAGQPAGSGRLSAVTVPLDRTRTVAAVTLPTTGATSTTGASSPELHVFDIAVRAAAAAPAGQFWAGSWATAYGAAPLVPQSPDWSRQTLRMVVHPNTTGGTARFRFANTFSPDPLELGHVTVATQANSDTQQADATAVQTPVPLTFGGAQSTTLAAGADVYSDPVAFPVTAGKNLLVSVYLPGPVTHAPIHPHALTTSYTTSRLGGDHTMDTGSFPGNGFTFWTILSGVDVATSSDIGTTVALGDSQTDGAHSPANRDQRWPDYYAQDVNSKGQVTGVVNEGISGNYLLTDTTTENGPSALHRLDRDVFGQTDVHTLVLYEGVNDIALSGSSATAVEAGISSIAQQARARGIRVVIATIPPFGGYSAYTDAKDTVRQQVNAYVRTTADADAHIDFDLATRDPDMPDRLLPAYFDAPDDHLHFNEVGCAKLADTLAAAADGPATNMSQTAAADVNGDGLSDLLARNDATGALQLWLRNTGGTFGAAVTVTGGWRPFSQTAAADFNSDGKADIIARDGSGNLKMWLGHGDGTFGAAQQVTSGWDFTQTAVADFDGNGKADIIARDSSGNLKIWAGHGDGTFGAAAQLSTGWDFTQTAAADFNGDGQADIIARDAAGNLKMWTHNAGGYFNAATQVTTGWDFSQTVAADFDGNGKADIIARRNTTGDLDMWAGHGDTTFGSAVKLTSGW